MIPGTPATFACDAAPTVDCSTNNNACFNFTCVDDGSGSPKCDPVSIINCDDSLDCTTDSCDPLLGCQNPTDVVCDDSDRCTTDTCDNALGGCQFNRVTDCSCDANPCTNVACGDGDLCTIDTCISDPVLWPIGSNGGNTKLCTDLPSPFDQQCANALMGNCSATFCYSGGRAQCLNTNCTQLSCDALTGQCAFLSSTVCDDNDPCTKDLCVEAQGGCTYANRTCAQFSACELRECIPEEALKGHFCNVTTQINCDDGSNCTTDTCHPVQGCLNVNKKCEVSSPCHILLGCDNVTGACSELLITTLLDFCGVCLGDNISCFFQQVEDFTTGIGIGAGAAAGVVIATVIAILVGLWASKKGYDHYVAHSAGAAASAIENPMFAQSSTAGDAGDVFSAL